MESRFVVVKDQVSCDLAGEAVILRLEQATYFGLDPVGARIWELIQEPKTLGEIRDALVAEYDVEPVRCESAARRLLEELCEHRLAELHTASGEQSDAAPETK